MADRYEEPSADDWQYETLDELMCEYVDGTMDPAVRVVFEEYLAANPDIAAKAGCLKKTRSLLCQYGCHVEAPKGLHTRLRSRLACEMMQTQQAPLMAKTAEKVAPFVTVTSAVVVMVFVGMLASTFFIEVYSHESSGSPSVSQIRATPQHAGFADSKATFTSPPRVYPDDPLEAYTSFADTLRQTMPSLLVDSAP